MYEISVKSRFSAAHRLAGYEGTCAALHGHNWDVEVALRGGRLNRIGMLMDFRDLKRDVRETLAALDHTDLGAVAAFRDENPTSENIARFLYRQLSARLNRPGCAVDRVTVHETPETSATYREDGRKRRRAGGR